MLSLKILLGPKLELLVVRHPTFKKPTNLGDSYVTGLLLSTGLWESLNTAVKASEFKIIKTLKIPLTNLYMGHLLQD